jgi:hypothetical protein
MIELGCVGVFGLHLFDESKIAALALDYAFKRVELSRGEVAYLPDIASRTAAE